MLSQAITCHLLLLQLIDKTEKKSVPTSVNDDVQTAASGVGSQSESSSLSEVTFFRMLF